MNNLRVIDERTVLGKEFRMYGDFDNPLFLAKDVAEWIDYSKDGKGNRNVSTMLSTIGEAEKTKVFTNLNNSKVGSNTWFLTEEGLYEVLMQSRKPIAREFKTKVKEILKDIRIFGMYANTETVEKMLGIPDFVISLLTKYKEKKELCEKLEKQVEVDKPKIDLANAIVGTEDSILVASFAKLLNQNGVDIGQNRLYKWFRENGYLGKKGEYYNLPTQKAMNLGLFETKESVWYDKAGNPHLELVSMVTGKGQLYFVNKFKELFKSA